MLNAVEGLFRNGKVEFLEPPPQLEESRVLVTFLTNPTRVELAARGIDKTEAANPRAKLAPIAQDWDRPEMDVYDVE